MFGSKVLLLFCGLQFTVFHTHSVHAASLRVLNKRSDAQSNVQFRLPNNTRPLAYDIHIHTNVHSFDMEFSGFVRINIEALIDGTRTITLHQRQLRIGLVSLFETSNDGLLEIPVNAPEYSEINEQLTVTLGPGQADLEVGKVYVLTIEYSGTLRDDVGGFFHAEYLFNNGSERSFACTQFEFDNARHGFPCFDEPALKARFTIRITHGVEYHALSNMPIVSRLLSADNRTCTTTMAESPVMSTYLVAFVVSEFSSTDGTPDENGFIQKMFARPNNHLNLTFSLETGRRAITLFENRFDMKYTLPKLDHVAIPVPKFPGGMENWGLVIYKENVVTYSEDENAIGGNVQAAIIVAHEIVHQWFGNLVTNQWWTFFWLNEGFAQLYAYRGVDILFPEWRIMDLFVQQIFHKSMVLDATSTAQPMSMYVERPIDVMPRLWVHYVKAVSVLNMFVHAFSETQFSSGVSLYLARHRDGVVTEDDLFAALQDTVMGNHIQAENFTVANVMSSWTRQSGFPLITVQRNYTSGSVRLQQQRYFSDPTTIADSTSKWWVPYNLATASEARFNDTQAEGWLTPFVDSLDIDAGVSNADWLLVNKRQTGYYRVMYDMQNYALLAEALVRDPNVIHVTTRSQLVDDVFALVQSEHLDYGKVLEVIKYLEHEVEYLPWASAERGLMEIDRYLSSSSNFGEYKTYIERLLRNLYIDSDLSAKTTDVHRRFARPLAIRLACLYGNAKCLKDTNAMLQSVLAGNETLHPDYRAAVLCAGTRSATREQFEQIWERFQLESVLSARKEWIDALGCSTETEHWRSIVEGVLNVTHTHQLTAEDQSLLFNAVMTTRSGAAQLLELLNILLRDNQRAPIIKNLINDHVLELTQHVHENSAEMSVKFSILVESGAFTSDNIQMANQIIHKNNQWIRRNQIVIDDWIRKNRWNNVPVTSSQLDIDVDINSV